MSDEQIGFRERAMGAKSLPRRSQPASELPLDLRRAWPDGFLDCVEQGFAGPYLEMFARRARFGWAYFGDESLGTAA